MIKKLIYIFSCLSICLFISVQAGAQTCNTNFKVSTQIINSTCLSNGEITVTLGGDLTNIMNVQYGLSSENGFTINPQSDNVLRNIPPGKYELTVRAFCSIDNEYNTVKKISNLVVGGTYKVLEVSLNSDVSRKPYQDCNTGIIALNVTNGSGNFTFTMTSAPAGVTTPAAIVPVKSGNTYRFPSENYPAGNYTVQVDDGCYTSVRDFTLTAVSGFPTFIYESPTGFSSDFNRTDNSCGYVRWTGTASQINTNSDYKRYYEEGFYEIGAAPAGQMPTRWTDWNSVASAGILLDISPYNISNFHAANSIEIFTRLKGCNTTYRSFTTNINRPAMNNSIKAMNCDNYTYYVRPHDVNYLAVLCYPLNVKVERTTSPTGIVYNKSDWWYDINKDDGIPLDYGASYKTTISDQNGITITGNVSYSRNLSLGNDQFDCDSYNFHYRPRGKTHNCLPIEFTITDLQTNTEVLRHIIDKAAFSNSGPLEYGKDYKITETYPDGYTYSTMKNVASNLPTTYTLSRLVPIDNRCMVNRGSFDIATTKSWPAGTAFTITGPVGYTTQVATSSSNVRNITLPEATMPPGIYTLTVDHGCGKPIISTFDMPGVYNYKDFDYTTEMTCYGLKVMPTGTVLYEGAPSATYYRLVSGPEGYDKGVISQGESFTLSAPGTYVVGILNEKKSTTCVMSSKTIAYTSSALALDPSATSAYVCVGETVGNISIKAENGVAPYTYQLWNEDNTVKISGVADITTNGAAHFTHGLANETYTVRIKDQCGSNFNQEVTISNLQTAKIVYASANPVCSGGSIELRCITLGNTNYSWTGPNGFTSNEQNPTITNVQSNMTGWYTVSVMPEFCGTAKQDSVYITVTHPLEPTPGTAHQTIEACVREKVTLTAEVTGGDGSYTYQWQSSSDGIVWKDIAGANGASYTPDNQTQSGTFYYRRITFDSTCGTVYNHITLNLKACGIIVNPNLRIKTVM